MSAEAEPLAMPPEDRSAAPKIDEVIRRVTEVSTLPQVAVRVIQVARDPNAGAIDLRMIVEGDPALSSKILKCVNSAAYGLQSRVNNLQRAIGLLGFKQVRNIAVAASVSKMFKDPTPIGTYTRRGLWKHMISVGVAARLIAMRCNLQSFEEIFLCGLMHDLGIILEDQYCHDQFEAIVNDLSTEFTLAQLEQRHLGFDHSQFGARIAEVWRFPEEVRDCVRFHHMFGSYRGPFKDHVACVELANLICTVKGITSVGMKLVRPAQAAMDHLQASRDDVKVWAQDLDDEIKQNESLFDL